MERVSDAPGALASIARVWRFTAVMYKPHYLLYGIVWVLAVEGTAALVSQPDTAWRPGWATVVRIAVVAAVLLYLRMVDEQKDLEYDRIHNPDRPLVTGAVSAGELRAAMAVIAVVTVGASLALSVGSALAMAATLGYGLFLWAVERRSVAVREGILLNLLVTYPVQLVLTAYVLVSAIDTGEVSATPRLFAVAVLFAGAFLQFEFARKTSREHRAGEHLYSNALGVTGGTVAIVVFAALASVVDILLVRSWGYTGAEAALAWIPLALLVIPVAGAVAFRRGTKPDYPILPAVGFVFALYLTLIAQAVVLTPT
ncbi:hypothetical protein IU433_23415 [Nocardia puris]|nr:hypothetical protein [Nocardia puris]MBF6367056.1 hypothetical protein [Nocardia puris]MBF6461967.1 hypothetical protein [Nocardia puris]